MTLDEEKDNIFMSLLECMNTKRHTFEFCRQMRTLSRIKNNESSSQYDSTESVGLSCTIFSSSVLMLKVPLLNVWEWMSEPINPIFCFGANQKCQTAGGASRQVRGRATSGLILVWYIRVVNSAALSYLNTFIQVYKSLSPNRNTYMQI